MTCKPQWYEMLFTKKIEVKLVLCTVEHHAIHSIFDSLCCKEAKEHRRDFSCLYSFNQWDVAVKMNLKRMCWWMRPPLILARPQLSRPTEKVNGLAIPHIYILRPLSKQFKDLFVNNCVILLPFRLNEHPRTRGWGAHTRRRFEW